MPIKKVLLLSAIAISAGVTSASAATYNVFLPSAKVCLRDARPAIGYLAPACNQITRAFAIRWNQLDQTTRGRFTTNCKGYTFVNSEGTRFSKITIQCLRRSVTTGRVVKTSTGTFLYRNRGNGVLVSH